MGFVYGMLENAKYETKIVCNWKEAAWSPIINIIEKESRGSTLHLWAYYLNPYYYYRIGQSKITHLLGLQSCITSMDSIPNIAFNIRPAHMNSLCTWKRDLWEVEWRIGIEWALMAQKISIQVTFTFKNFKNYIKF